MTTTALLTDMNQPLGRMAGNAVEVDESVAALEGRGPADLDGGDAGAGRRAARVDRQGGDACERGVRATLQKTIDSGAAREKFAEMVRRPGRRPRRAAARCPGQRSGRAARRLCRGDRRREARPGDHRHGRRTAAARRQARSSRPASRCSCGSATASTRASRWCGCSPSRKSAERRAADAAGGDSDWPTSGRRWGRSFWIASGSADCGPARHRRLYGWAPHFFFQAG